MNKIKSFTIILILTASFFSARSQTIIYHENFELPSSGDSIISSGSPGWAINTNLFNGGQQSDSSYVEVSDTTFLTTTSFSTIGNYFVLLEFSHICKIEFNDFAVIEVSNDNGLTWIRLVDSNYLGGGQFGSQGNKFSSVSYVTDWQATNSFAIPTNQWWKTEQFDISPLVSNTSQVKVRFMLFDGNLNGAGNNYGWLIDDISVSIAYSELLPPVITLNQPVIDDTVYNTGPFTISADIIDGSGIDTAILVYTINGLYPDTLGLQYLGGDTYSVDIPSHTYDNTICYHILATDLSPAANVGKYPAIGCDSFYIMQGPSVVQIGTGTSYVYYIPCYGYYDYGWSAMVYKSDEINTGGIIDSISYYVDNAISPYQMTNQKVYMSHVSQAIFTNTNKPDPSSMTLVFDGTINWNGPGWNKIALQNLFGYNGIDHLLIYYENWDGSGISSGYPRFRYTTTSPDYYSKYRYQSGSFPNISGNMSYYRPNIRLAFNATNYPYDAGISKIIQPIAGVVLADSLLPVEVLVKNYGTDTLVKATVQYSIDDIPKSTYLWTGCLLQDVVSTPVIIGGDSLSVGSHIIKVWTNNPNDSADQNHFNDTAHVNLYACSSILNGVYTIGGSVADFLTINEALQNLAICGLNGPVTFNINSGTYYTQIEIPEISGTSETHTITFQSATGNYQDVIIEYDSFSYSNNYIIKLNGAKHIRFKNMTLRNNNATYSHIIEYAGNTKDNQFIGNHFIAPIANTTSTYNALVYSPSGTANVDTMSVFESNIFENGAYGLYMYGGSTNYEDSTQILNNHFINQLSRAIQMYYQDAPIISGNYITSANYTLFYGIYCYYCSNNAQITKNIINLNNGPNQAYGIYLYSSSGTQGNEVLIANNFITMGSSFTAIGLYINTCIYQHIYHNSIDMIVSDQDWNVRTVNIQGTSNNLELKNNIFANSGGGLTLVAFLATGVVSDYNVLFTTGGYIGAWGSPTAYVQPTLAAWRTASGQDYNSVANNPGFYSVTDMHTQSPNINNIGTPLPTVSDDIDGDPRSTTAPDPGADEFSVYPYDAGVIAVNAPNIASCGLTNTEDVIVKIKNFGSNTLNNFSVSYILNNGNPVTETVSISIPPWGILNYTFSTKANMSASGNHYLTCYTSLTNDGYHKNDSILDFTVMNSHNFSTGIYSMGFEAFENTDGWMIQDVNSDNHTWEFPFNNPTASNGSLNCARFLSDSLYNGNDWLYSRCFYFQVNTAYKISFFYKTQSSLYPHKMDLKLGTSNTVSGMTTSLITLPNITNTIYSDISTVFTVPVSGVYYFGWHAYSDSTNYGTTYDLYLDDITVDLAPSNDAEMLELIAPAGGCGLTNETVQVIIRNLGNNTLSGNMTANYQLVGDTTIITENITSSVLPGDTLYYSFNSTADLSVSGADSIFEIICWVNLNGDVDNNNDTIFEAVISRYRPADPIVSNVTVPYGNSATITAISSDSLFWYDVPVGGIEIGTGNSFTTPVLYDTASFYVEARAGSASLKITEIAQYGLYGAGMTNPYPTWIVGDDLIEITNLGSSAVNLQNYVMHFYYSTISTIYTMPNISLAAGEIIVLNLGSGTDDPVHNYYNMSSGYSLGSNSQAGFVLRNSMGYIVDAVATNGYTFQPTSGITQNDWSGNVPSSISKAGIIRIYSDNNDASDWVVSDNPSPIQTFGSINPQLTIGGLFTGCASNRVSVLVYVTGIPAYDASVESIISPISGIDLTNSEPVKIKIRNYGSSDISNFNAGYILDGALPVIESINNTVNSGDTLIYTFGTPVNVGNYTTYSLKAFTDLNNDASPLNDTAASSIKNSMLTYCISKATSLDRLDIGRVRIVNVFDNGSSTPAYSNPNAFKTYTDYTYLPPIQLAPGQSYTMLVHKIHPGTSSYACYINVFIDYNMDGYFDMATELVSGIGISNSALAALITLPIPAAANSVNTRMRIVMKEAGTATNTVPCGTYTYGETEDYNVIIAPTIPNDAGVTEILQPAATEDEGTSAPMKVVVKNYGQNDITTMDISYSINGGSPITTVWTGMLLPDDVDTIQLSNFIVPAGITNIKAYTDLNFDWNTVNDSRFKQITGVVTVNLPYVDDFEGGNYWINSDSIGNNQWERGEPDGSVINTPHSPINVWAVNLDESYLDFSFDHLYTPKINFSQVSDAQMSFYHWMDCISEDGGRLQYSINNGVSWVTLGTVNDSAATNWYTTITSTGANIWSGQTSGWILSTYDLSSFDYAPFPVQFRFNFISDASGTSDGWAIDDFKITLPPVPYDVTPLSIVEPSVPTPMGSTVQLKVKIKNLGTTTINSMNLGYTINNGNPVTELWTGSIAPNATMDYIFSNTFVSPISNYSVCIFTALSGDAHTFNDTLCDVVNIAPALKDAGVSAIISPSGTTNPGSQVYVTVSIKNYGTDPITNLDVSYTSANNPPVTENWTGNLQQNTTVNHTFTTPYLSPAGIYNLCGFTTYTGDPNAVNDEICINIQGIVGVEENEINNLRL
ncbi:GEVED domain-containing protein, partial [candidate division KSB1 bacterium]